ncbi:MAG: LPS export ABC transporter periplasmic protein LptC [Bacteroidales bacterium]|nr:LPS export ABC transporter periplasmic protein LptC [Bacteroidales bacterium]
MNNISHNLYFPKLLKNISLLILEALLLLSCENDIEVINTITATSDVPKQTADSIEIIYSDSAIIQLKIFASKLEYYQKEEDNSYIEFPKGILVYFYRYDQTIRSKLTANYAIYYEPKKLWEARNNVVAINEDGEILNTELLFWDEEKEIIYTNKFAKVKDQNSEIQGEGFESDQNFTNWEFKKVTGIILLEENK